jgi:hypothetical protein
MTRTILRTATIALATAALAAPSALARPDTNTQPLAGGHHATNHFATRPVLDRPSAPAGIQADQAPSARPVTVSVADHGIDWTTIALGIAGSLLAVGTIAAITGHTRRARHPRIAA